MSDPQETGPEGAANVIETDYEIGQDNIQPKIGPLVFDVHNPVFLISGLTIVAFVILTLALQEHAESVFNALRVWLTVDLRLVLPAGGQHLRARVGGDHDLAAGQGAHRRHGRDAGLFLSRLVLDAVRRRHGHRAHVLRRVRAAVALPVVSGTKSAGSPDSWAPLAGRPATEEARRLGMAATIFHWALHPWAIYAVVALSLALFAYNKGLPLERALDLLPDLRRPGVGLDRPCHRHPGGVRHAVRLATSLGIGAEQANAGLEFLFGMPVTDVSKVVLILAITAIALVSILLGLDRGVKRLSEINLGLAALLLLFVIIFGPTLAIITGFFANLWAYAEYLPALSNPFGREDDELPPGLDAFYWAWWISWSPFVGMFIARVSRGRTVREFIFWVLVIPSLVSVLWMTAMGGTAITMLTDGYAAVGEAALELKLFAMLDNLPLAAITSFVGIVLVIVFFVTSSDSGSLVIDTITAGGKIDAPVSQRIFWACFEGLVAIALLLGGGLGRAAGGGGVDGAAVRHRAAAGVRGPGDGADERAAHARAGGAPGGGPGRQ
jgi:betaine/carnitine transporter, BCCT family